MAKTEKLEPNLPRLNELHNVIDSIELKHLDMNLWVCGTQACLAGYAAQWPEFVKQGLKLVTVDGCLVPRFVNNPYGFITLAKFFNITSNQVNHIFSPAPYKGQTRPALWELHAHVKDIEMGMWT